MQGPSLMPHGSGYRWVSGIAGDRAALCFSHEINFFAPLRLRGGFGLCTSSGDPASALKNLSSRFQNTVTYFCGRAMGHGFSLRKLQMKPQMNTHPCSSVALTCKSLSGGQGYFDREDAKKSDFKNFAFFASSRWIFWVAAGLHCVHLWFRS